MVVKGFTQPHMKCNTFRDDTDNVGFRKRMPHEFDHVQTLHHPYFMGAAAVQPIAAELIRWDFIDTPRIIVKIDRIENNDTIIF